MNAEIRSQVSGESRLGRPVDAFWYDIYTALLQQTGTLHTDLTLFEQRIGSSMDSYAVYEDTLSYDNGSVCVITPRIDHNTPLFRGVPGAMSISRSINGDVFETVIQVRHGVVSHISQYEGDTAKVASGAFVQLSEQGKFIAQSSLSPKRFDQLIVCLDCQINLNPEFQSLLHEPSAIGIATYALGKRNAFST